MQLSVVIPSLNEANNLRILLPSLIQTIKGLLNEYEVLIIDGGSQDDTEDVVKDSGGKYIRQSGAGYGDALVTGIRFSQGQYILTMDADFSHDPTFIRMLWQGRNRADILIASRYVQGGSASMPLFREILSRILNVVFGIALSLPIHDLSSGYRLYRAPVVKGMKVLGRDFDVLQEIITRAFADGWKVEEIPFHYVPRKHGRSHAKLIRFGISYLKTFGRMWRIRKS
jgi:dolichol-phosphate mannosyltransferase